MLPKPRRITNTPPEPIDAASARIRLDKKLCLEKLRREEKYSKILHEKVENAILTGTYYFVIPSSDMTIKFEIWLEALGYKIENVSCQKDGIDEYHIKF